MVDPNVLIARLKNENEVLKKELEQINGVSVREFLTEEDKNDCRSFIQRFLQNSEVDLPKFLKDRLMLRETLSVMKSLI